MTTACITEIKSFATHDGPGIRTTVFMKGCPLRCHWCSNPETQKGEPELYFMPRRCMDSGACIRDCPELAIMPGNPVSLERSRCTGCMKCVESCVNGAFQVTGHTRTVEEVFRIVEKDRPFYKSTGGLTLSGGEPLFQPEFALALLGKCRESGISTVLDTSGSAPASVAEKAAILSDLVLIDIKHMDPDRHQEGTGSSNTRIIENAGRFAQKTKIRISLPLIPGYNDDEKNLTETAVFAQSLGSEYIDINPLHMLGKDKYAGLGLKDPYAAYYCPDKDLIAKCKQIIENAGVKTTLGRMM